MSDGSFRTIIDRADAASLAPDDPNLAAHPGDNDHENHIGDPTDDDLGVAVALATLDIVPAADDPRAA